MKSEVGAQACYSFSKRFGKCMTAKAGSKCPEGRRHVCYVCGGSHAAKDNGCKEVKKKTSP